MKDEQYLCLKHKCVILKSTKGKPEAAYLIYKMLKLMFKPSLLADNGGYFLSLKIYRLPFFCVEGFFIPSEEGKPPRFGFP